MKTFMHDLLLRTDKLNMAHSIETRVPFLDNDLVEYSLSCLANSNFDYSVFQILTKYKKIFKKYHLIILVNHSLTDLKWIFFLDKKNFKK